MTFLARTLAQFAADLQIDDIPSWVVEDARGRIVDILGLCCAAVDQSTCQQTHAVARRWGGPPEARVVGSTERLSVTAAAFANGVLAHALDFDDTHLPSVLHPSASIVPAALAVADSNDASVEALLSALVVGYEVCIRTGMACHDASVGNSGFFERGWHATSICGTLGSAVAAAKLMGGDADTICNALGIAASMSSGLLEGNRSGGTIKRLHCGWAAKAGVVAAQCALEGVTGPESILEGRFGFFQAYCGTFDPRAVNEDLGLRWSQRGIHYKPYPCNHFSHAAIDAALELRGEIELGAIERIILRLPGPVLRTLAEPREAKLRPASGYQALFSGPFIVAIALTGGGGLGVGLDDFTDAHIADPELLKLAAKVYCVSDPRCDAVFPDSFPAILSIHLRSGAVLERAVLDNWGGPSRPLSLEDLTRKYETNTQRHVPLDTARRTARAFLSETTKAVSTLPWLVCDEGLVRDEARTKPE